MFKKKKKAFQGSVKLSFASSVATGEDQDHVHVPE